MELTFYNSSNIIFRSVYQWDMNRIIKIAGVDVAEGLEYKVHFSNRKMRNAIITEPVAETITVVDAFGEETSVSVLTTTIPNRLTEEPYPIDVYVYTINSSTKETITIKHSILSIVLRCSAVTYPRNRITVYYTGYPADATYSFNTLAELTSWLRAGRIDESAVIDPNSCKVIIGEDIDMSAFAPGQFANDNHIYSIQLNESVTEIPIAAFQFCIYLKEVKLGSKVKSIGTAAFIDTRSLTTINLPDTLETIEDYAFSKSDHLAQNMDLLTYIKIPKSVTKIGGYAFQNRVNLKTVDLDESGDITFEMYAFAYCYELEKFAIPKGVTHIPGYMFYNCKKLGKLVIPSSVSTVDSTPLYGAGSDLSQMTVYLGNSKFTPWNNGLWGNACPVSVIPI